MRCEEIQPNLLDYGKGLLTGRESRRVKAHLANCAVCAALLEDEMSFAQRLASVSEERPAHDVWALVRAQTKPKTFSVRACLVRLWPTRLISRRTMVAAAAAAFLAFSVYGFNPTKDQPAPPEATRHEIAVKWSDDPLGGHSDAMVEVIAKM